ncbi:MAG: response regulator [Thermodesulfobacteriota bacterium]|nr:response regulator [Thermodesulfobacteriota bacterium]
MKILIAEDDFTSRTMLKSILTKSGYTVMGTTNGIDAYEALQEKNTPQMAVLDWEMPGMNGQTLCRKLRRLNLKTPPYLILLTSRNNPEDLIQGLDAGADDYVTKPYHRAELQARINVGRRMIDFQNKMLEREKLEGVLEMAGAVCHELNQPLQTVSGYLELLMMEIDEKDKNYRYAESIHSGITRIGKLTRKIMGITSSELLTSANFECIIIFYI